MHWLELQRLYREVNNPVETGSLTMAQNRPANLGFPSPRTKGPATPKELLKKVAKVHKSM